MPVGKPDFAINPYQLMAWENPQISEIAARLGSPVTYDRVGNVVLIDRFDYGLGGWELYTSGEGAYIAPTVERFFSSKMSVKLVAGKTDYRYARIARCFSGIGNSRYGIYCRALFPVKPEFFVMALEKRDGYTDYVAKIRLNFDQNSIDYLDRNNQFVKFGDLRKIWGALTNFVALKLVVDFYTNTYVRFFLDDLVFDLSGIEFFRYSVESPVVLFCVLELVSHGGENDWAYVDDFVFTVNEP